MLGFVLGDMYCQGGSLFLPPKLGKHFPIPLGYQLHGRVSAAIMTIETLLNTPYPQKRYRELIYGAYLERQRLLFAEHVIVARLEGDEGLALSIDLSFIATAVSVGLIAISEELALLTAPRPKKAHPHYEVLCKVIDCVVMLMFYGKVIRQRNAVLEDIGHQFGYHPAPDLTARIGKGEGDDYEAFMVNILTCIAHSGSFKEALENGARMGMREPAFFCIVGAIASTLWGIPKLWAYQASQLINRSHPYYIQNLMRCEARAGLSQVNLVAPRPSPFVWLWQQVARLFKDAA